MPGSTLRQVLNDRGRLPAAEAAEVGAQIADAWRPRTPRGSCTAT
ncbi:MAG: hypothetical protein ACXVP3_00495 [Actinomycetota bacterium]